MYLFNSLLLGRMIPTWSKIRGLKSLKSTFIAAVIQRIIRTGRVVAGRVAWRTRASRGIACDSFHTRDRRRRRRSPRILCARIDSRYRMPRQWEVTDAFGSRRRQQPRSNSHLATVRRLLLRPPFIARSWILDDAYFSRILMLAENRLFLDLRSQRISSGIFDLYFNFNPFVNDALKSNSAHGVYGTWRCK